jgi:hypothetical protein
MDEAKILTHPVERLRMPQKQIPVRQKIIEEVANDALLGNQIEVDQHIAAKDDVHVFH